MLGIIYPARYKKGLIDDFRALFLVKKGENMDDNFNYWVNQYHDTDQEVYREIIYTAIIDTTKVVDDKVIVDETLKKLYQRINVATTQEEILKIKKEYHDFIKE